MASKIEWTDVTWNPVTGCTKVSPGCRHCYAERVATTGLTARNFPKGFDLDLHPDRLGYPAKWSSSKLIFVCSMSDLFHRAIPDEYLVEIWNVMVTEARHVFQVLTKRPHRMQHKIEKLGLPLPPHIWLGTSVENQKMAESRIPALLAIPRFTAGFGHGYTRAVRFISAEPLLGTVDLDGVGECLNWIIAGGESGSGRTPMDLAWARDLRDFAGQNGIPFFFKQGGAFRPGRDRMLDGEQWNEFPLPPRQDHPILTDTWHRRGKNP